MARLAPHPDVPPSIRRLPAAEAPPPGEGLLRRRSVLPRPSLPVARRPRSSAALATVHLSRARRPPSRPCLPTAIACRSPSAATPSRSCRLAKDLLRHAIPSGDDAAVLDRALTALLTDLARKKFAATETPQASRGTAPGSRHIPAEVKRAVLLRDLGRCSFVGTTGRRCGERGFVEFHHVRPYAAGGEATLDNLQLRCRAHNAYEARAYFGPSLGAPARSDRP